MSDHYSVAGMVIYESDRNISLGQFMQQKGNLLKYTK